MSANTEKIKYDPYDYLYGTARVRALEKKLLNHSLIERALEAKTPAEVCAVLRENGLDIDARDYERALGGLLREVYAEVEAMTPDRSFIDILRYPYDCHNIKSALKCALRGIKTGNMLYEVGSVPCGEIIAMAGSRDFALLPPHMANAAPEALDDYAVTRDPQLLDARLDCACYADMAARAKDFGESFFIGWVESKADTTNILTCVRIMRMTGEDADLAFLERMLVPGGTLGTDFFKSRFSDGEAALWSGLSFTRYESIVKRIDESGIYSLSFVERVCEDCCIEYARQARNVLAGAQALGAYIIATEFEIKDIRIILAGKQSGADNDTIRERLRGTYV